MRVCVRVCTKACVDALTNNLIYINMFTCMNNTCIHTNTYKNIHHVCVCVCVCVCERKRVVDEHNEHVHTLTQIQL